MKSEKFGLYFFEPKSTVLQLMKSVSGLFDINKSSCIYAFSGTDEGIKLSHQYNVSSKLCGLNDYPITALFNKIEQHKLLSNIAKNMAFDIVNYFDDKKKLIDYCKNKKNELVIRPEISFQNGSAIIYRPYESSFNKAVDWLFTKTNKVIVHRFVPGNIYIINGIMHLKRLIITDCWKCFTLDKPARRILTSVINVKNDNIEILEIFQKLENLCLELKIYNSPMHFEIVVTKNDFKIIKFLPRLASEPLPTLCNLLGITGQKNTMYSILLKKELYTNIIINYFVADYSFVLNKAGRLLRIKYFDKIITLLSYYGVYYLPNCGDYLEETVSGQTYATTILLKSTSEQQVLHDINLCQKYNHIGIFELEN